jgi:hypothetical protein
MDIFIHSLAAIFGVLIFNPLSMAKAAFVS